MKLSPTPDVDPSQDGYEEGQHYAGIIGGVLAVCLVAILIGMSGLAVALLAGFKYRRRYEQFSIHILVQSSFYLSALDSEFCLAETKAYTLSIPKTCDVILSQSSVPLLYSRRRRPAEKDSPTHVQVQGCSDRLSVTVCINPIHPNVKEAETMY